MSVAALSTAGFSQYISASSNVSASQQAFQSLEQSLASGNLTAAQSAFNAYQQLNQSSTAGSSSSSTSGSSSTSNSTAASQFSKDLTALGTAIGSGNLTDAQSAFATVQSDLKQTPSQAVTNAETAVAQTVQWVDDLLSLSSTNSEPTTPVDPTTAMLDSAYGLNSSSTSTDPTTSILDSAYGGGSTTGTASSGANASAPSSTAPGSGNTGNAASVNAYA
jgi:hypothetical protein